MRKIFLSLLAALLLTGSAVAGTFEESVNNFSLKFLNASYKKKKNILISPYSIYIAFSPVYEGAENNTEKELKRGFLYPEKSVLRKLIKEEIEEKKSDENLKLFNGIYIQKGFKLKGNFLKTVTNFYQPEIKQVDFKNKTERIKTVNLINRDVEKTTKGKIKNLLKPSDVNSLSRLIIVNAIHFKDNWLIPFKKELTENKPFYTLGKTVKVPMMKTSGRFKTFENETVKAISLFYKNCYRMNIFVPKTENFKLTYENYNNVLNKLNFKNVDLEMPKFKLKNRTYLKKPLSKIGIKDVFNMEADLSEMTGKKNLYVQKAIHQTFINVDENGTEAAAATAVVIGLKSILPRPKKLFKIDRPFFFTITDKKGTILFTGYIANPLEE
ncbi:serpin family protein [Desulfurobacterium atlanticum]|uniref:Serpin B n=1 Tax=Desulfurobacterium atlanticum TaxID=240169 RepID=A0A238YXT4_9BACT|nr:serpin family protein [Desulfurobacterium atlanticum]SNR75443.1 serpin B [Desulfurobacterium atlanticum]